LGRLVNKNNHRNISFDFKVNGNSCADPTTIVNTFNEYFSNVGKNLASKIPVSTPSHVSYLKGSYSSSFALYPTSVHEIIDVTKQLPNKKSSGFDEITVDILKQSIISIAEPLTLIVNASFSTGIVPRLIKIAKVCPVYKGGAKDEFSNYRPISVLPSMSKIFEKLVYNRLSKYLTKLNILSQYQYGFRSNHSTYMALLDFYNKVSKCIDDKNIAIGVFIDLQKAFDTLDHSVLLSKLAHYGVRGISHTWFSNYLVNRKQYIYLNNCVSDYSSVVCGVPQGSILGPLLFLLYINDIVNCSRMLYFTLFADDTNLLYFDKDSSRLVSLLNNEL